MTAFEVTLVGIGGALVSLLLAAMCVIAGVDKLSDLLGSLFDFGDW